MQSRQLKCSYCLQKLRDSFISCASCEAIRLCVNCFLSGAEGGRHKNNHPYTVKSFRPGPPESLFGSQGDWSFLEENKLLDAVETYGYGNWHEIAVQLAPRGSVECQVHYDQFYVYGLIGQITRQVKAARGFVWDQTIADSNEYLYTSSVLRPDEQKLFGYMPYRDEFEYEYQNNAERTLVTASFGHADELEKELRLALVSIYNKHLSERRLRHKVAHEHDLLPLLFRTTLAETSKTKWRYGPRPVGKRVYRRRKFSLSVSRGKRKYYRSQNVRHYRRLKDSREVSKPATTKSFRMIASDVHTQRRLSVSDTYPGSHSDSGIKELSNSVHTNALYTNTQSDLVSGPDQLLSGALCQNIEPVESGLFSHPEQKRLEPIISNNHNTVVAGCAPFNQNLGTNSNATSDSGIGSCDSCTQSDISNGDPSVCKSTTGTPTLRLSSVGRPRSISDSVCLPSSFTPIKQSPKSHKDLMDVSCASESTPTRAQLFRSPVYADEGTSSSELQPMVAVQSPTRQSSAYFRRNVRVPRCKRFNVVNNTYPSWLKPFVRFLTRQEANKILVNMEREAVLRYQLEQLMDYHRKGIRSMSQIELLPTINGDDSVMNKVIVRNRGSAKVLTNRSLPVRVLRYTRCRAGLYRQKSTRVAKERCNATRRCHQKNRPSATLGVRKRRRPL